MKNAVLFALMLLPLLTAAQFGILDNNFDADGLVSIDLGSSGYTQAYDVGVQSDGKILVIGTTETPLGLAPFIARMFPDGSLDQTFGVNGVSVLLVNNGEFDARGMVLQQDGKTVLVGAGILDGVVGVFAMRVNDSDGFADATFGTNGVALIPYPSDSYLMDVALQSDGKIVASGYSTESDTDALVVRLNSDGTLDDTFSFDGKVTTDVNDGDSGYGLVVGADGKITLAGLTFTGAESNTLLVRYNTDGTLDNTFGTNGVLQQDLATGNSGFYDVVQTASGSIYACGLAESLGDNDFLVAKFNSDGTLDNSFALNGVDTYDFVGEDDQANELLIQPDGRVLVVGEASDPGGSVAAMVRYNENGLYDSSFGNAGEVLTMIDDQAFMDAVVLQEDLKILAAGVSLDGSDQKAVVARYTSGMNVGIGEVDAYIGTTLIYPNPITENTITVEYELNQVQEVSISLFDMNGKLISVPQPEIEEAAGVYQKRLSIGNVSAGNNYLIQLNTNKGVVSVKLTVN